MFILTGCAAKHVAAFQFTKLQLLTLMHPFWPGLLHDRCLGYIVQEPSGAAALPHWRQIIRCSSVQVWSGEVESAEDHRGLAQR